MKVLKDCMRHCKNIRLKGVTIGHGSVEAAGAVVTKSNN